MKATKFKMTELGPIPEDWEVKRLEDVCSDYAYGTGAEAVEYDGENKYIRITDINEDSHLFTPSPLTSPSSFSEGHIVQENDLLIARTGASVGKTYFYSKADGKLIFAGFLMKASVKKAEGKFVFYQTLTDAYKKWVLSESARSGQPGINIRQLRTLPIPLPPLPEQRRIAAALSDMDELIGALGKLVEKKRAIKTGTMQQLLTGKRRLPGFGDKWVEKRLGDCGTWLGGGTPSTNISYYWHGSIPWISSSDIEEGDIWNVSKTRFISNEAIANSATCICPKGCIHIVSRVGIGKVAIAAEPVCTSQDYANLVPIQCDNQFMAFLISVVMLSKKEETQGTSIKGMTLEDLKKIVLLIPPTLSEQRAIAAVLSDMDAEIAALEAEQAKYARIKFGMMQELLTGKTRLV